jgi:O-antigen ligase
MLTAPQRIALSERFISSESVVMRLSVWEAAVLQMLDDPFRLVVGWGPEATLRQMDRPHMKQLLTGSLGNTEGAFDSTAVGLLVEYGIVLTALTVVYVTIWLLATIRAYRMTGDPLALTMLAMSTALIFCFHVSTVQLYTAIADCLATICSPSFPTQVG